MAKRPPFKQRFTVAMQRRRAEALVNGRDTNAAYTSGAQEVGGSKDRKGYSTNQKEAMRQAWEDKREVPTYTSSKTGRLSTDGNKAGGSTWTFTEKDADGKTVRQSGRNKMATRRQRDYDVRVGIRKWEQEHGRRFGALPGEAGSEPGSGSGGVGMALSAG